ncbi:MAG: hypothetical protein WCA35_22965 [Kovacikia sp.]
MVYLASDEIQSKGIQLVVNAIAHLQPKPLQIQSRIPESLSFPQSYRHAPALSGKSGRPSSAAMRSPHHLLASAA